MQTSPPGLVLDTVLLSIFLCETFGVAQTNASNAAFLISLCVMLTPFVEWFVFRQRPENTAFIAAVASLCGVLWLQESINPDRLAGRSADCRRLNVDRSPTLSQNTWNQSCYSHCRCPGGLHQP